MSFRLTRREVLSVSATGLATAGFARASKGKPAAASIPPVEAVITGGEPRVDFEKYRKIVVSPDVNPPEPFHGFGGYCGWPTVCRLQNGDLLTARGESLASIETVPAPAGQGAIRVHTGSMCPNRNAVRRDAGTVECRDDFCHGLLRR